MNTSEQIIEAYKNELREYDKWFRGKRDEYGFRPNETINPMDSFGRSDWNKYLQWYSVLKGIEKVLGLTIIFKIDPPPVKGIDYLKKQLEDLRKLALDKR